jgi:MFS family permease
VSALAMAGLAVSGLVGPAWPLPPTVFVLGVANGAFSIAAIASMMQLATDGPAQREGVRMGLWGAAQGVAFGLGGVIGTGACDLARLAVRVARRGLCQRVRCSRRVMFLLARAHRLGPCTCRTQPHGLRPGGIGSTTA